MSKIERYQGNVHAFASGAQGVERTVFGETTQANDLTSQITAAFLRGWGIIGPSEHPSLEDFNGAMYALSQFIAYQHQAGIPEWHEEQEYYVGSICTHDGESYQSLVDSNVGNEPPSTAWTPILTSNNGLQNLDLGTAAQRDVGTGENQIPDMSAFPVSDSYSWYGFPSGIIHQIFAVNFTGTAGSVVTKTATFPTAFAVECLIVLPVDSATLGTTVDGTAITEISQTGFTVSFTGDNAFRNIKFLAIGR